MRYKHLHCGGEIIGRKCQRCHKYWSRAGFLLATDVRPLTDSKRRLREARTKGVTSFREAKSKGVASTKRVVSFLPKWPRWARVLTSLVVLALVTVGVVLLMRLI